MSFSTADLHDAQPDEVSVCETQFRSFGRHRNFCGRCRTVKTFEDHRLIKSVFTEPGEGQILVVDGGGSLRIGLMGDLMASLAIKNGWAGAVLFGVIRDSAAIDGMDFGVKAIGTTARRGAAEMAGLVDVPVSFGGVTFTPGDWVYADSDAVLVSARKLIA